ncbi:thiol-disulfide oxidoreductase DCC family protein [Halobacteriovorax sp. HLS]|uniref:thiol-disulfide oxidoreductase DCC family protein n=1 Tax=Halobacteriovorax sp. HLS TaxID=2234000 RepID=UPI000FD9CF0D|nr:DCC1-like thiol-disulfide oxidoreductase family protein [Halobacteriovorax sp. HLS]
MQQAIESPPPLLIFDGECSLCNRFAHSIKKFESTSHIEIESLHNDAIYIDHPYLSKEECEKKLHLVIDRDTILEGAAAVEHLIKLNPAIKKISWLIESDAGQKAMNLFYKSANVYRESLLNRCPKCKNK